MTGPSALLPLLLSGFLLVPAHLAAAQFEAAPDYVIDGDSIVVKANLATGPSMVHCRMLRYNAPEMTGPEKPGGIKARDRLRELVAGKTLIIRTEKKDRHGRFLCDAWLPDGTYLNDRMRDFLKDYPKRDIYLWMEGR